MSIEAWLESTILIAAFLLLTTSGLVEASLIRRQRMTIREILDNGPDVGNAERGFDQGGDLRAAVDVATLVAVVLIAATVTHASLRHFEPIWLPAVLLFSMLLVLVSGRLIPVAIVERFSLADSDVVQRIAVSISALMGPFLMLMHLGGTLLERKNGQLATIDDVRSSGQHSGESPDDQESSERDEIEHDEHEMISGILSMEDAFAREIMIPRPDVVAVALDTPVADVVRVAQEAGHSRIPVFEDSIDRVRGIVYAKDLLRFVTDDVEAIELAELMRPAMYVPESKRVDDLLRDLRRSRVHMAIVVDEYGGTAGLVTIEDIIEEIVGEIQDEYDRELPLYQFEDDGAAIVDGRMSVDELAELFGVSMPETESETVGGLVQRELGHIPEPGESISAGPVSIRVERVERRRVTSVQVVILDDPLPLDTPDPMRAN